MLLRSLLLVATLRAGLLRSRRGRVSARVLELDTIRADFELASGVEALALIHEAGGEINADEMLAGYQSDRPPPRDTSHGPGGEARLYRLARVCRPSSSPEIIERREHLV